MPLHLDLSQVRARIPQLEQEWYRVVLETMKERREQEIEDVDTVEAFKEPMRRLDPELKNWHFWRRWRYCWAKDMYDWETPETVTIREDLSDDAYYALSEDERAVVYDREFHRRVHGLWMFLPWFLALGPVEQEEAFAERPHECLVQCLTGSHYFFLTYTHIVYDTESDTGVYDFPVLRRRDALLHMQLALSTMLQTTAEEDRPGLDVPKARRIGFSTNLLAAIINLITIKKRYSASIHVNQGDLSEKYYKKNLAPMLEYMPSWFLPHKIENGKRVPFITPHVTKQNATLTVGYWDYEKGKERNSNEFSFLQIVGPDSKYVESGRYDLVYRDEYPKWDTPYVTTFTNAQEKVLLNATTRRRVGASITGGTSNASNPKGLDAWRIRRKQMEIKDCHIFFGGEQYYYKIDEYGWANEQSFVDYIENVRRELREAEAYDELLDNQMQHAIYIDDCYVSGNSNRFNPSICQAQITRIREELKTEARTPRYGWFVPNPSNIFRPQWRECQPGEIPKWTLYDLPPDNWCQGDVNVPPPVSLAYSAGSDNVSMHLEGNRERELAKALEGKSRRLSLSAMYIINTVSGETVAQYLYRHANADEDFEQKLMACFYYGCRVMPENNVPGEINYFRGKTHGPLGRGFFLKRYMHRTPQRPEFPGRSKDSYGVSTKNNKDMLINEYLMRLWDTSYHLWHSERLMKDLSEWTTDRNAYNPDTGMAMLMSSIARVVNLEAKEHEEHAAADSKQVAFARKLQEGSRRNQALSRLHLT